MMVQEPRRPTPLNSPVSLSPAQSWRRVCPLSRRMRTSRDARVRGLRSLPPSRSAHRLTSIITWQVDYLEHDDDALLVQMQVDL